MYSCLRPAGFVAPAIFSAGLFLALAVVSPAASPPAKSGPGQHAAAGKEVAAQGEKDWVDARWNQTDVGPFLASILKTPTGPIAKALSIRVGEGIGTNAATVCYDTKACVFRGGWVGGFLKFSGSRFGLTDAPAPVGEWAFVAGGAQWEGAVVRHEALRLHGARVVLESRIGGTSVRESPWVETVGSLVVFTRTLELATGDEPLTQTLVAQAGAVAVMETNQGTSVAVLEHKGRLHAVAKIGDAGGSLAAGDGRVQIHFKPRREPARIKLLLWSGPREKFGDFQKHAAAVATAAVLENLAELSRPGPARWLPAITNAGQVGFPADGFAVDTITVPYANPWKALLFCSGVDFFRDGSAAVCTIHGDVWRVSGLDAPLRAVTWKRLATGLFQPLGLRVVNDRVHVLGRDQITVLHDENGDGEADRYENFCNLIDTSTGGHNYVTCLERDAAGNFYYVDPTGVQRVSPDGRTKETLGTGFRNPNGLGVRPDGLVTATPQQGTWTPSSAIVEVRRGGFYGFGGPKVTAERPLGYDAPLCWLPHGFDNSSSSQVWVPEGQWGALGGRMLHLLWGRCALALVLRDEVDGQAQGAAVALPVRFLSGPMRATFHPGDGHLYVAGSTGWQTSAARDGSLQRVRRIAADARTPVAWHAHRNGLTLTFAQPLDRSAAEDVGSYSLRQWNYRYTGAYGSKDYSVSDPNKEGRDEVMVRSARLLPDGKSVFIETAELRPVMQMELKYNLQFIGGASASGPLYLTLNRLDPAHVAAPTPSETNRKAVVSTTAPLPAWPALEWQKGAPSPWARVESPTAVVGGKLYLFGGFTETLAAANQLDVYDPASDSWTRKKDMPTRVTHLNPALDGPTIWFAGGFKGKHPGPVTDEVWKYDHTADTWSVGPPLPEARAGGGLEVVGRRLHYFGGYKSDRQTDSADHWSLALDGGKGWEREADLPDPRGHVSAAVLDGKLYALGGAHGHDKTQNDLSSCHRFDPATKKWTQIASLPDGRSHFESSTLIYQGRILVVGGRCNQSTPMRNVVGDLLEYNPQADAWRVVGELPVKVLAPSAAIIGGRLIVTGGGLNNPRPLTAATWIAPLPTQAGR